MSTNPNGTYEIVPYGDYYKVFIYCRPDVEAEWSFVPWDGVLYPTRRAANKAARDNFWIKE
jgi:hypothetical protein